ncbi:NAC domain-containing protein 14 [Ananas comosus]|uniref:NAC domain-containing protein 14 n=1 Tax=Ananas comosus TaxID=4615 RepID=A0A199V7U4_ANACO|nr:NAC domain-containing protein 14 [Ananas comosus]
MTVPLQSLPLGFRFHPTDEELVNHYLKRKINGRIKSEAEVIPEIDVCKCEPWDLPGKSLIRSDDPEWFFFAPKDRKYANGHRSNRATEKGYWKATGKDRIIRAKNAATGSKKHKPAVIGMKKTLVFHRGRAPRGVRTGWIMHEYRTTEPEFDSGEQGGYVLYRLFKKEEDKTPSSNVEDVETTGLSPSPCKSSPVDAQHEAEATEEISIPLNQESTPLILQEDLRSLEQPAEIKRCLVDKPESSTAYHIKPDENFRNLTPDANTGEAGEMADPPQDLFAGLDDDLRYEQIDPNEFPRISSPMLPYTDHPFFGNINQGSPSGYFDLDNNHDDSINDFLNSVLTNSDERPPPCSNIQTEFNLLELHSGTVYSSWCKDSATSSDSDGTPGLDAPDRSRGFARVPNPPPPLPPRLPHISSPTYSTSSAAESLHDSSNAMEESSTQNSAISNGDNLDETGIMIRVRPLMDSTFALEQQGTAARRLRLETDVINRLETAIRNASYVGTDSETSTTKDDFGDDASISSNDGIECRASNSEVEEDADDNIPESNDVLDPNVVDKLKELSVHDHKSQPGSAHQDAQGMLRLRTKQSENNEGIKKNALCATRNPRIGSVNYMFWSVLRAIFLLLRFVIFLLLCLVIFLLFCFVILVCMEFRSAGM